MKIVWTEFSKIEVKRIYQYYKDKAGVATARKIKTGIIRAPEILRKYAHSGQEESNLMLFKQNHRYLVEGNYKVVYRLIEKTIYITDVFDCRQDSQKMKSRSK